MPRKRSAEAPSPISGIASGIGALLFCSQGSSQGSVVVGSQGSILAHDHCMDSMDGSQSQQYSQPDYFSGDFCTPEDQTADLNWSQEQRDTENAEPNSAASSASKMCPPTPDSVAKRRKTRPASAHQRASKSQFVYDLDGVPEDDEEEEDESKAKPAKVTAPSKQRPTAGNSKKGGKGQTKSPPDVPRKLGTSDIRKWCMSQESASADATNSCEASPSGGRKAADRIETQSPQTNSLFGPKGSKDGVRRLSSGGTKVGAKACRRNPFLANTLTEKERKMPSRALPQLAKGEKATRYLQDFDELSKLGEGNFGAVSLVRSRLDGQKYAVKRKAGSMDASAQLSKHEEKNMREIWAMAALAHVPYVVRYYGAWCENSQLFIQMEACECHIHERYFGKQPSAAVLLQLIQQIGAALAGMHAMGMAHLDVKPDNIYCSGDDFRLGDFGLVCSQQMVLEGVEPDEGDGRYASPQVIQGFSQLEVKELAPCDVSPVFASVSVRFFFPVIDSPQRPVS